MAQKILLVEDNEFIIELMTYILTDNGYEVVSLTYGKEVFNTVIAYQPDLVILDAQLPDADGRKICQRLKTHIDTEYVPVIICSAREDIRESLKQVGPPNDVLSKPFELKFLIEKVRHHIAA